MYHARILYRRGLVVTKEELTFHQMLRVSHTGSLSSNSSVETAYFFPELNVACVATKYPYKDGQPTYFRFYGGDWLAHEVIKNFLNERDRSHC